MNAPQAKIFQILLFKLRMDARWDDLSLRNRNPPPPSKMKIFWPPPKTKNFQIPISHYPILQYQYPLKTPDNLRFSGGFRGFQMGTLVTSRLGRAFQKKNGKWMGGNGKYLARSDFDHSSHFQKQKQHSVNVEYQLKSKLAWHVYIKSIQLKWKWYRSNGCSWWGRGGIKIC